MRRIGVTFAVALLALAAAAPATPHLLKRQGGEAEHVYHQRLAHHGTTAVRWVERHRHLYRTTSASEARASPSYHRVIRNHQWLAETFAAKVRAWWIGEARRSLRSTATIRAYGLAEAVRLGVTGAELACLDDLVGREGGWNPFQYNGWGSGAYGIPQSLPGSKMASEGADWEWNPATQVRWMIRYCQRSYGGVCSALAFQRSRNWY